MFLSLVVLGRREQGKGSQGLAEREGGAQWLAGMGTAFSSSSPAREEPRLVRNVNKGETALAKQRPHDNSRPKQSYPGPHPHEKTSQAFVHTQ